MRVVFFFFLFNMQTFSFTSDGLKMTCLQSMPKAPLSLPFSLSFSLCFAASTRVLIMRVSYYSQSHSCRHHHLFNVSAKPLHTHTHLNSVCAIAHSLFERLQLASSRHCFFFFDALPLALKFCSLAPRCLFIRVPSYYAYMCVEASSFVCAFHYHCIQTRSFAWFHLILI